MHEWPDQKANIEIGVKNLEALPFRAEMFELNIDSGTHRPETPEKHWQGVIYREIVVSDPDHSIFPRPDLARMHYRIIQRLQGFVSHFEELLTCWRQIEASCGALYQREPDLVFDILQQAAQLRLRSIQL